ncbi:enoyl-CoA hydratase/isomerase family protein [Bacillus carboniphilus]|uniref:Enoyl-CoA hydratase/isomerase family protein n=1 Tax=Bacillus carboniphilus TaxID=86663 RepID=A0ABN0WIL6_9BACI
MSDYSIEEKFPHTIFFTIKRKQVHNAINYQVMQGFEEVIERIEQDHRIALLVITGEGDRAFCSGGDLQAFHSLHTAEESYQMLERMAHVLFKLATLPVPVVCLLNGTAVGGGMEIATACDIRYAKKTAKFGFIQANLAITTGWGGGTLFLEKFQPNFALEWLLKADKRDASELYEAGFLTGLFEGDPFELFAREFQSVLSHEPDVMRAYKNIYLQKLDKSSLLDRMLKEAENCSVLWQKDAHHLAVSKFLNKT